MCETKTLISVQGLVEPAVCSICDIRPVAKREVCKECFDFYFFSEDVKLSTTIVPKPEPEEDFDNSWEEFDEEKDDTEVLLEDLEEEDFDDDDDDEFENEEEEDDNLEFEDDFDEGIEEDDEFNEEDLEEEDPEL